VKQMTVFHFSPRYIGMEQQLRQEAATAYESSFRQRTEGSDFGIRPPARRGLCLRPGGNGECEMK
jgi:hypothetical protein